jgi:RHS repeat-associated protein
MTSSVFDNWNGQHVGYSYASGFTYTPAGAQTEMTMGNGVYTHVPYNNRQQICQVWIQNPQQTLMDKHYFYTAGSGYCANNTGNNGNIAQIQDMLNNNRSQVFGYDALNRLASFSNGDGSMQQSYTIDSFGNMSQSGTLNFQGNYTASGDNRINLNGYAYDAAGNLSSIFDGLFTATYAFDAESKVFNVNAGAGYYTYDAAGERMRKDAGGSFTEYQYLDGQPIAEKNSDGTWTDYIYANGQKIAKVDSETPTLHVHGNDCSTCNVGWVNSYFSSPIVGYQIQSGDTLFMSQKQVNIEGGFQLNTQQGGSTWPYVVDQNGDILNQSTAQSGVWQSRQVDLSQFAGQTVSNVTATITVSPPPNVVWDVYYRDIAIVSKDGSVHPIFTGNMQPSFTQSGVEGQTDLSASVDSIQNLPGDLTGTHFYHGDQIGSARMLTSAGGWPVSSDTFYPFGQEQNPTSDPNHYKFTGKERDAESGLDYFGARYYSSSMGRFTSPDWSEQAEPVPYGKLLNPQSLNLYSYVLNKPLSNADADGHSAATDADSTACAGANASGNYCGSSQPNLGAEQSRLSTALQIVYATTGVDLTAQQQGVAASCSGCSMNGAAGAAEKSALGMTADSQHHGKWQEFGGWVLKAIDGGGYSYTNPVATSGADGHFNPLGVSVPDGYVEVGYYHTHPHFTKENVEGEGFSGPEGDVGYIANHPGLGTAYVADTVSRNMYRITPRPGGDITPGVDSRGRTTWGTFVRHIPGDPYQ